MRGITTRIGAVLALSLLALAATPRTQQIGRAPVDVRVTQPPSYAVALGRAHLVYEIHLTSFANDVVRLERLDVLDDHGAELAGWSGAQLWARITVIGQPDRFEGALPAGVRAVAYLWVSLPPGQDPPAALVHRMTFAAGGPVTITTAPVPLAPEAGEPLAAPVEDGPWVAVRGPSPGSGHRLSLVTHGGQVRVPQRFAVDWLRLGENGLPFGGDPGDVENWHGYDETVHAVAGGTVVVARDGDADRPAMNAAVPAILEADEATGDAREPLAGEGMPFALASFRLVGRVAALPALLSGQAWAPDAAQPSREVTAEMPLENMVIRFRD